MPEELQSTTETIGKTSIIYPRPADSSSEEKQNVIARKEWSDSGMNDEAIPPAEAYSTTTANSNPPVSPLSRGVRGVKKIILALFLILTIFTGAVISIDPRLLFLKIETTQADFPQTVLTATKGEVFVNGAKIAQSRILQAGDEVKTSTGSQAVINFFDNSVSRLKENTSLKITTLDLNPENFNETKILFEIDTGEVWNKVTRFVTQESAFEIKSYNVIAGIRGSAFDFKIDPTTKLPEISALEHMVALTAVDPQTGKAVAKLNLIEGQKTRVKRVETGFKPASVGEKKRVPRQQKSPPDKGDLGGLEPQPKVSNQGQPPSTEQFIFDTRPLLASEKQSDWFQTNAALDQQFEQEVKQKNEQQKNDIVGFSPESPLYLVQKVNEQVAVSFAWNDTRRFLIRLEIANRRMAEAQILFAQNKQTEARALADEFQKEILAIQKEIENPLEKPPLTRGVGGLTVADKQKIQTRLRAVVETNQKFLGDVLPGEDLYAFKKLLAELKIDLAGNAEEKTQIQTQTQYAAAVDLLDLSKKAEKAKTVSIALNEFKTEFTTQSGADSLPVVKLAEENLVQKSRDEVFSSLPSGNTKTQAEIKLLEAEKMEGNLEQQILAKEDAEKQLGASDAQAQAALSASKAELEKANTELAEILDPLRPCTLAETDWEIADWTCDGATARTRNVTQVAQCDAQSPEAQKPSEKETCTAGDVCMNGICQKSAEPEPPVSLSAPEIAAVSWQADKVQLTFTGATAAESYKLCENGATIENPVIANKMFTPTDGIKSYSLAACKWPDNCGQCGTKVFTIVKGTQADEIQTAINAVAQNTNYIAVSPKPLLIAANTYNANNLNTADKYLHLESNLHILGQSRDNTVIQTGFVIDGKENVTVEGVKIENLSNIIDTGIDWAWKRYIGIYVKGITNNVIIDNNIITAIDSIFNNWANIAKITNNEIINADTLFAITNANGTIESIKLNSIKLTKEKSVGIFNYAKSNNAIIKEILWNNMIIGKDIGIQTKAKNPNKAQVLSFKENWQETHCKGWPWATWKTEDYGDIAKDWKDCIFD